VRVAAARAPSPRSEDSKLPHGRFRSKLKCSYCRCFRKGPAQTPGGRAEARGNSTVTAPPPRRAPAKACHAPAPALPRPRLRANARPLPPKPARSTAARCSHLRAAPARRREGTPVAARGPRRLSPERQVDSSIGSESEGHLRRRRVGAHPPDFRAHRVTCASEPSCSGFSFRPGGHAGKLRLCQPATTVTRRRRGQRDRCPYCARRSPLQCTDKSQAGANMRFRVNPELHIRDKTADHVEIDMLGQSGDSAQTRRRGTPRPTGTTGAALHLDETVTSPSRVCDTQVPPNSLGVNASATTRCVQAAGVSTAHPLGHASPPIREKLHSLGLRHFREQWRRDGSDGSFPRWTASFSPHGITSSPVRLRRLGFRHEGPPRHHGSDDGGQPYELAAARRPRQ